MRYRGWGVLVIFALASLCAILINRGPGTFKTFRAQAEERPARAVPVLVELFTSEGCSSCPPADELLARLERMQPVAGALVIALSEHVDYWNRLGWVDPYSSAEFSARQGEYATRLNSDSYTPQMVVDGRAEFVGSDAGEASRAIAAALETPRATVTVTRAADAPARAAAIPLAVRVEALPAISSNDQADVLLAVAESGLRSEVSRGENSGRSLTHTGVARRLSRIGSIDSRRAGSFEARPVVALEKAWKRENLRAVVFVQERASRRVLGAASLALGAKD
ncbi:MAG: DUF1223 domain-containing protein [Blastocatellia bacterium]